MVSKLSWSWRYLLGILFCLSLATAFPKNNGMTRDGWKGAQLQQTLPEVPGYIPVYIQHGDQPPAWRQGQRPKLRPGSGHHKGRLQHVANKITKTGRFHV